MAAAITAGSNVTESEQSTGHVHAIGLFRPRAGRWERPWAAHRGGAAEALRRGCFCSHCAPTPLCGVGLASSERPLEPTKCIGARARAEADAGARPEEE